jgi:hypothetical protein
MFGVFYLHFENLENPAISNDCRLIKKCFFLCVVDGQQKTYTSVEYKAKTKKTKQNKNKPEKNKKSHWATHSTKS